jgi:uncharacterized protein YjbI with pentapeptide repeats
MQCRTHKACRRRDRTAGAVLASAPQASARGTGHCQHGTAILIGMAKDQRDPPSNAQELLSRYAAGDRSFRFAGLHGEDLRKANLSKASLCEADFGEAELREADLHEANLNAASFFQADLTGADLRDAELCCVNFYDAYLTAANLAGADLEGADLSYASLEGASLAGAILSGANFTGANLKAVDFGGARLDRTVLSDVDLAALCDANPPVHHDGPSVVDHRSILRSLRAPRLKDFLARAGMPEVFVEYMVDCALSLKLDIFNMLQSTFISYGAPDEAFAKKLYQELHRNGVTTFFFAEHAEPGEKLHRMMRKGVNEYDRVLLICSKNSLDRKGVLNELEEILAREARDGGASYLIPIRLDSYVFTGWKPPNADIAQAVRDRVVADFEGADKDDAKFQAGLQKLIRALKKSP